MRVVARGQGKPTRNSGLWPEASAACAAECSLHASEPLAWRQSLETGRSTAMLMRSASTSLMSYSSNSLRWLSSGRLGAEASSTLWLLDCSHEVGR